MDETQPVEFSNFNISSVETDEFPYAVINIEAIILICRGIPSLLVQYCS